MMEGFVSFASEAGQGGAQKDGDLGSGIHYVGQSPEANNKATLLLRTLYLINVTESLFPSKSLKDTKSSSLNSLGSADQQRVVSTVLVPGGPGQQLL